MHGISGWIKLNTFSRVLTNTVLLISMFFVSMPILADTDQANTWLLQQIGVNADVSSDTDITYGFQANSEALITLETLNIATSSQLQALRARLIGLDFTTTEELSRQLIHRASSQEPTSEQISDLLQREAILNGLSLSQVGVGTFPYYDDNALETAFVLQAMFASSFANSQVVDLITYLNSLQNADGSFGDSQLAKDNLYTTYQALSALHNFRSQFNLENQINSAVSYINSLRNPAGNWGGSYETAVALLAVIPATADLAQYQNALSSLSDSQISNGSWQNDAYITALAARALYISENVTSPTPITAGNVTGLVVTSQGGQILDGALVEVVLSSNNNIRHQAITSDTGSFIVSGIEAGEYFINVSLAGFQAFSGQIVVTAGATGNLGQIALSPSTSVPVLGSVFGVVTDSDSGAPIANAAISISDGVNVQNALTNGLGEYTATVAPGVITISVTAATYDTAQGSGQLTSGGTLSYSPQLFATDTTPTDTSSDIVGFVFNQNDDTPIAEAVISIAGTAPLSSDTQGAFEISDVTETELIIEISREGFLSRTISVAVPASNVININVGLLPEDTELPSSNILGQVLDGDSNLAVDNVQVTLSNGSVLLTDTNGDFSFADVDQGTYTLTLSKAGYLSVEYQFNLGSGVDAQLTDLLIFEDIQLTASSVSGVITDQTTGDAIPGAEVLIAELNLQATADATGRYQIDNISLTSFNISVTSPGYFARNSRVSSDRHANISGDVALQAAVGLSDISINSVETNLASYPAFSEVELTAFVENASDVDADTLFYIRVTNSQNQVVEERAEVTIPLGATASDAIRTIAAGQETAFEISWFTNAHPADDYEVTVQALSPQGNQLLSQNSASFTIESTSAISGLAEFTPPLAQLAAQEPVDITATIMNRGNVDLEAGTVTATVSIRNLGASQNSVSSNAVRTGAITDVQTPSTMVLDSQGNTYVLDAAEDSISRISPSGEVELILTDLLEPIDIDIDDEGVLYVFNRRSEVNFSNSSIDIFDVDLSKTTLELNHPSVRSTDNIEVTDSGDIFITQFDDEIFQVHEDGETTLIVGLGLNSGYRDVVKNSQGDLFFSETNQDGIYRLRNDQLTRFADVEAAHGLAIDSADNIYVTSYLSNGAGALSKVSPNGDVSEITSGLNLPWDVAIEPGETSFIVSNNGSDEVVRVDSSGTTEVLIASTTVSSESVAYNSASELFVESSRSNDIRKFTTPNTTDIVAGSFGGVSDLEFSQSGELFALRFNDVFMINQVDGSNTRVVDTTGFTVQDFEVTDTGFLLAENRNVYQSDAAGVVSKIIENPFNNSVPIIDTMSDGSPIIYRFSTTNTPAGLIHYNSTGEITTIPVDLGTNFITDIEVSSSDDVYLSNRTNDTIYIVDSSGVLTELVNLDFDPGALALDETNNRLLVSELNRVAIHSIDLNTNQVSLFVELPQAILSSSASLEIDSTGNIWLLNSSARLVRISNDGSQIDTFTDLGTFSSIHFSNGDVYAHGRSTTVNTIFRIAADGSSATEFSTSDEYNSFLRGFVFDSSNNINAVARSFIRIINPSTNAIVDEYADISTLRDIVQSDVDGQIIGVTSSGMVTLVPGQMPRTLQAVRSINEIEADANNGQYILHSSNSVFRFTRNTGDISELVSGFSNITDIAVAPNGNIAITESALNRTTVVDSSGSPVSENIGLDRPQGIAVAPSGDVIVTNEVPNNVFQYSIASKAFSPFFDDTILTGIDFINLSADGSALNFVSNFTFGTTDLATRELTRLSETTEFGQSFFNNFIVEDDVVYGIRNAANEYAVIELDRSTLAFDVLSAGLSNLTDIDSYQDNLYVLDGSASSVDQVGLNGSLTRVLSGLARPSSFQLASNGDFHVSSRQLLTVFDGSNREINNSFDLSGLFLSGRAFSAFSFNQSRYLLDLDVLNSIEIVDVGGNALSSEFSIGDVLFTQTLPIDALSIDSGAINLDFGDWLPPTDGDFSLNVSHSTADSSLTNVLHVGGSANGALTVATQTVFPGDRSINGGIDVVGADFTTISQINTDAVTLAASTGASGRAVAGDSRGNIYAASGTRIVKVAPDGTITDFVSGLDSAIGNGLAVDSQDNVYAISGVDILKITPLGELSTFTTLPLNATFVTVDASDRVFASENTRVYEISASGEQTVIASLNGIRSIARDNFDNTYVLLSNSRIVRILPDGSISSHYSDARFEFEGVNMVTDCANNILYAPFSDTGIGRPAIKEEDVVAQINGTTGEASQIFFGPTFDRALADIDVLYFDRINQRLLMFTDISQGKVFSFPVICGGIDVDVVLVTRDDVDISSASPAPTRQTDIGDGQTRYFWDLSEVPNSGTSIDLRFLFDNLVVDEQRPALAEAYLEFTNSFTPEEVIRVPLDIPSVNVEQPVALNVALDRSQYVAFENVAITNTVENLSDAPYDGRLEYQIKDANGDVVTTFTEQQVDGLEGFIQGAFNDEWNTGGILVGAYTIQSTLFDQRGNITATASDAFEIVDELDVSNTPGATLSTRADRSLYNINDSVEISNLPANISLNTILENVRLNVVVINSRDEQVHQFSRDFVQLIPNFNQHYIDTYTFVDAPEGEYRIVGQLLSDTGEILAQDVATYQVSFNAIVDLIGDVSLAVPLLIPGDSQICTDTIENSSNVDIGEQRFRQLLIDATRSALLIEREFTESIEQQGRILLARGVDTSGLALGVYACSIQMFVGDTWSTLDTEYFEVVAPQPILSANDDSLFLRRGLFGTSQVLTNDVIENLDDVTVSIVEQPENGTLIDAGQGVFNYRSQLTFLGQDEFTYQLESPSTGLRDTAKVVIDVGPGISCSVVPDHITQSDQLVKLPEWARTPGDTIRPSRYAIEILSVSDPSAFATNGMPVIDHPSCDLSYTPKANVNQVVTVTYRVTDVATNGADYTSLNRTFTLTIDTRGEVSPGAVIVPILKLLLLDEQEQALPEAP